MRNKQFSYLVVVALIATVLAVEVAASASKAEQHTTITYLQCLKALRATEGN